MFCLGPCSFSFCLRPCGVFVMSWSVLRLEMSCHGPCCVLSCLVMVHVVSCHVLSWSVLCLVMSCLGQCCLVFFGVLSWHGLCCVLSCLSLCCLFLSWSVLRLVLFLVRVVPCLVLSDVVRAVSCLRPVLYSVPFWFVLCLNCFRLVLYFVPFWSVLCLVFVLCCILSRSGP